MRRVWLIVLLVALLPLRGWASAGMAVSAAPSQLLVQAQVQVQEQVQAMPCHAGPSNIAPAQVEDAGEASHLCVSCDLCHAALATAACASTGPSPMSGSGPLVGASRDTGRLLAGCLERPPRA